MDRSKQKWQSEYIVHTFNMSDVEDPDLWASESLLKFEKSELGQWLMKNTNPIPSWHRVPCEYGWQYQIRAMLTPEQYTYYSLKFK